MHAGLALISDLKTRIPLTCRWFQSRIVRGRTIRRGKCLGLLKKNLGRWATDGHSPFLITVINPLKAPIKAIYSALFLPQTPLSGAPSGYRMTGRYYYLKVT